jgi:hypothetical protein
MSVKTFLEAAGKDFMKGLDVILPYAETTGEAAVAVFAPSLGPLFNQTVTAIVTAEQNAAAAGTQAKTGEAKLKAVISIAGSLIEQGLKDAGKSATAADVTNYINSVVGVLNVAPAPASPAPATS